MRLADVYHDFLEEGEVVGVALNTRRDQCLPFGLENTFKTSEWGRATTVFGRVVLFSTKP
ncbi:hypothetical protein GCM10007928_48760 [Sulfitobacter porphyrae]|nr:hypothetical protein GCM10007928_48760 [Sulfitobacter porphyrae]